MAVQGKKINELTAIGTVSDETVLPAVYVSGTTVNSTANKISVEQISNKVQSDMSTALSGKQDTLVSGTNIKTINNESLLGSGNLDVNGLPSQSGQSGKFLTTDGTNASWAQVSIPEGGADTSLSNLTDAGKIQVAHLAMPSNTYTDLTYTAPSQTFQAPADGYFFFNVDSISNDGVMHLSVYQPGASEADKQNTFAAYYGCADARPYLNSEAKQTVPVLKGQYCTIKCTNPRLNPSPKYVCRFIYAKGSESEKEESN